MPAAGNPVARSEWVLGPDFLDFWMAMDDATSGDFDKTVAAFQKKWPQLKENNIVVKMKAMHKKYASGLPTTPMKRDTTSYEDIESKHKGLVPR